MSTTGSDYVIAASDVEVKVRNLQRFGVVTDILQPGQPFLMAMF